jgi:hypothetical protein
MNDTTQQLPEHDRLLTRPEGELPQKQDLKAPIHDPKDPKRVPPEGQGTDPKAGDIGRAA